MLKPLIVAVAMLMSLSLRGAQAETLRDQIEHLEASWQSAYDRGDGKAAAALVTGDVVVINDKGKTVGGGDLYRQIVDRYAKAAKLSIKIDDVQALGDNAAMATGNYVANVTANKGEWMEQGYWLRLYVREGGAWKIRASSFSLKQPPTATVTVR